MDPAVEGFGDLRIDGGAEPHHAAESRLDMTAGAAEPLVQIQMAERGVEVVAPHQADHAPSEPDTFRVAGRAVDGLSRFHELVSLALAFLGGIAGSLLGRVVLSPEIATLGDRSPDSDKQGESRNGNSLKNGNSKPVTNPTHEIPDEWRASRQRSAPNRCPAIAAEDSLYRNCLIPMKDIYVFVQQGGSLKWVWSPDAARRPGAGGVWGLGRAPVTGYRRCSLEDGTHFASHAPGPSGHISQRYCRSLVVVSHADRIGARSD